jgi:hypothetical protein
MINCRSGLFHTPSRAPARARVWVGNYHVDHVSLSQSIEQNDVANCMVKSVPKCIMLKLSRNRESLSCAGVRKPIKVNYPRWNRPEHNTSPKLSLRLGCAGRSQAAGSGGLARMIARPSSASAPKGAAASRPQKIINPPGSARER